MFFQAPVPLGPTADGSANGTSKTEMNRKKDDKFDKF